MRITPMRIQCGRNRSGLNAHSMPIPIEPLSLVHEEPRSKCKVRERGCVATVRVIIDESPLQKSSK